MRADDPILKKCRSVLASLYGERLRGVVLYGSSARGAETAESDVDLLVLLEGPVEVGGEIRRIWNVLYPVQLECDQVISVMPADEESYRRGDYPLYRNVREHGVMV